MQNIFDGLLMCGLLFLITEPTEPPKLTEHEGIIQMHAEAVRVREAAGIKTHYTLDAECCRLAQQHADRMAANHSMQHGPHDQIIAMGQRSIPHAIGTWRNSGPHWSWMAGRHSRAGWGYQRASNGTYFYCGVFRR